MKAVDLPGKISKENWIVYVGAIDAYNSNYIIQIFDINDDIPPKGLKGLLQNINM